MTNKRPMKIKNKKIILLSLTPKLDLNIVAVTDCLGQITMFSVKKLTVLLQTDLVR